MLTICHFMTVLHFLLVSAGCKTVRLCAQISVYSRSTLHLEGAHGLEAKLHHVAALRGELMAAALEALLIKHDDLTEK